eukprot:1053451-Prorocentrum_minimum.AAC.1
MTSPLASWSHTLLALAVRSRCPLLSRDWLLLRADAPSPHAIGFRCQVEMLAQELARIPGVSVNPSCGLRKQPASQVSADSETVRQ